MLNILFNLLLIQIFFLFLLHVSYKIFFDMLSKRSINISFLAPLFDRVKEFEGLRLKAYKCPSGVLTIGYGHTYGVLSNMVIDVAIAEDFLFQDLLVSFCSVRTIHPKLVPSSGLCLALVDFVFNVGITKYKNSTLRKVVDSIKDYSHLTENEILSLSVQFSLWTKSKGRVLRGLEKRRNFEISLLYE